MEHRVVIVDVVVFVVLPREKQSKFISQATTNKAKGPKSQGWLGTSTKPPGCDVSKYMRREAEWWWHIKGDRTAHPARKQPAEITKVNPQKAESHKNAWKAYALHGPQPPGEAISPTQHPRDAGDQNRNRKPSPKAFEKLQIELSQS